MVKSLIEIKYFYIYNIKFNNHNSINVYTLISLMREITFFILSQFF